MDETEILSRIKDEGFFVDMGNLWGPFIPDGMIRIYKDDISVVAEGETLQEAYDRFMLYVR